jgi:hypothetical protein
MSRQEISAYTEHDDPNGLTVNEVVIAFVLAHTGTLRDSFGT